MFFHLIKGHPFFTTSKGTQLYLYFLYFTSFFCFLLHTYLVFFFSCHFAFNFDYWAWVRTLWHFPSMQLACSQVKIQHFFFKVWLASIFSSTSRHQMFSLTMNSNFYIVHPCQPQQRLLTSWSTVCHCAQCDHCDQF